jgi:hypothetical protein
LQQKKPNSSNQHQQSTPSSKGSKKEHQLVSQSSFEQPTTLSATTAKIMGKHEIKRGISHRSSDASESS